MKILAVDVGTGTQDILLFDSTRAVENCLKLVMPSPTLLVADAIRQATAKRQHVVLTGTLMGGGPSSWAAEDHRRAGLRVYATPAAAADAPASWNDLSSAGSAKMAATRWANSAPIEVAKTRAPKQASSRNSHCQRRPLDWDRRRAPMSAAK